VATGKYNVCNRGHREWVEITLFDALCDIQQGKARYCKCGGRSHLELTFEFGRGKYPHKCKVLAAFLPKRLDNSWVEGKFQRSFYPFLVIVKSIDESHRSIWLPYWHVDKPKKGASIPKYGQWASFVSERLFASLVRQARAKGYKF
jgi:hypothetical protein